MHTFIMKWKFSKESSLKNNSAFLMHMPSFNIQIKTLHML